MFATFAVCEFLSKFFITAKTALNLSHFVLVLDEVAGQRDFGVESYAAPSYLRALWLLFSQILAFSLAKTMLNLIF